MCSTAHNHKNITQHSHQYHSTSTSISLSHIIQVKKFNYFITFTRNVIKKEALDRYLEKFGNLRVDKNKNRYTLVKAPHKPILLISLITLHKCGRANLADIQVETDLLELWAELWSCLEYNRTGPIYLPLYHMKSDGFWNLSYKTEQRPPQVRSINQFNRTVSTISLDDDLLPLIDENETRNDLINALLNGGYFSTTEIEKLKQKIGEMILSFEYEKKLNEQISQEFKMDGKIDDTVLRPSRDPAFRRLILKSYAGTCAVCGARLVTSSGISVIDAAHILPFSRFRNDDLRNGMALCKTHHWLFDKGLISVDEHYRALVSKAIEKEEPEGMVSRFTGKEIRLPESAEKFPSQVALEWHRGEVFYKE